LYKTLTPFCMVCTKFGDEEPVNARGCVTGHRANAVFYPKSKNQSQS